MSSSCFFQMLKPGSIKILRREPCKCLRHSGHAVWLLQHLPGRWRGWYLANRLDLWWLSPRLGAPCLLLLSQLLVGTSTPPVRSLLCWLYKVADMASNSMTQPRGTGPSIAHVPSTHLCLLPLCGSLAEVCLYKM